MGLSNITETERKQNSEDPPQQFGDSCNIFNDSSLQEPVVALLRAPTMEISNT